jgi:intein-encoded DNA endonuclease-like protein
MPIFKRKNENFFKKWSPEMAYILGFFCADGSMFVNPRGSHYIAFYSNDRLILQKIKIAMGMAHKIGVRNLRGGWQNKSYVLQIGSREMFYDLKRLGLTENKSKNIRMPSVSARYIPHFIRGYFDGDGNVAVSLYRRKDRGNRIMRTMFAGFTSGSRDFLEDVKIHLQHHAFLNGGTLYFSNRGHRLYYSVNDSKKLYHFMYTGLRTPLFLERKKKVFESY